MPTVDADFLARLTADLVAELAARRTVEDLVEAISW